MKTLRVPADALKWVAAGCALVATASAEYEIARTIGMHPWVAAAVPGALDAYVLRALRAHREVLAAVLAMVGVNAASHLVTAGLIPLDWRLVTAVSAIAPLVLWRVHALGASTHAEPEPEHGWGNEDQGAPGEREHPEHAGTVSVPGDVLPPLPVRVPGEHVTACLCAHSGEHESLCACTVACPAPCGGVLGYSAPEDEMRGCPVFGCAHGAGHAGECLILPAVPTHVPAQWSTPPNLHLVKDMSTPSTDDDVMELARVLMGRTGGVPTVRALKKELSLGTPRAQRVRAVLEAEHTGAQEGEQ